MSVAVTYTVKGEAAAVQRLRTGLGPAGKAAMHGRIATAVSDMIRAYVASDDSHATAQRLGAKPTGHMAKTARRIEAEATAEMAIVKIPRKSRLRAAFGGFEIRPGPGKTFLAIPDHPLTYGKMPSKFPRETFDFQILAGHRLFPVLKWADGPEKGKVAYWLKRSQTVKEDRTLLPWEEIPELAARVAGGYAITLADSGGSGGSGGNTNSMPERQTWERIL